MMRTMLAVAVLAMSLFGAGFARASNAVVETQHLVVSDSTGKLTQEQLEGFAARTQELLLRILDLWSAESGVERFGKVRIVLDASPRGGCTSVCYWDRQNGQRARAVRVFGCADAPQTLAHKLTSAVFPQKDKLIRNLMGLITERKLGNRSSFPMCGLDVDDWAAALAQAKANTPLSDLGPDHESWGMQDAGGGKIAVLDRARQHKAYAEAGSFGDYLFRTYGLDRLKRLQRLSQDRERPMQEAFGRSLQELEADWLQSLQARASARPEALATASRLLREDPRTACTVAQRLGAAGRTP